MTQSFFGVFSKYRLPESFILPFFTGKVSTVTFSEGGYTLSQSQSDKLLTFNNLFPTSGAVTKDREKFDQKLTGAGRVQPATARRISASVPFSFLKWRMVLLSRDRSQCRTSQVKMRNI